MEIQALKQEVSFRTSRSSGAGGQNVNKVETKVDVLFDLSNSRMLTDEEKARVAYRLENRINKEGILVLSNQASRSQLANKEAVLTELFETLEKAIVPPKKRKKVKPKVADAAKRLDIKKRTSEKKTERRKVTALPKEE